MASLSPLKSTSTASARPAASRYLPISAPSLIPARIKYSPSKCAGVSPSKLAHKECHGVLKYLPKCYMYTIFGSFTNNTNRSNTVITKDSAGLVKLSCSLVTINSEMKAWEIYVQSPPIWRSHFDIWFLSHWEQLFFSL